MCPFSIKYSPGTKSCFLFQIIDTVSCNKKAHSLIAKSQFNIATYPENHSTKMFVAEQ